MRSVHSIHETIIGPVSPTNPRNGEGAMVPLRDGRLLLAWSRFLGGEDHAAAEIWARQSTDGGGTWGEPYLLQPNVGGCNVMSVSLLRLAMGDLLLGYLVKDHASADCHLFVRRSADEGDSWSEPVPATPEEGYFVVNNDRLVQTQSGRLLVPASKSIVGTEHSVAGCFLSDDEGATWRRAAPYIDLSGIIGLQEPGIVELADGGLWMYQRTNEGRIYASRSADGGESWGSAEPTTLVAPQAPATAKRLPGSGAILMIYNDRQGVPYSPEWKNPFHHRTPLVAVVSEDGGRTWGHAQLVEADTTHSYCYTSIAFQGDVTLLTYYVGRAGGPNLMDLKLKIVPTAAWTA
ncbi:MAG: sialidase family protein [Anaerolineae bacterium]